MKHLTIFLLCLFLAPAYAQKSYRPILNQDLSIKSKSILDLTEKFDAKKANSLYKSITRFHWDQDMKDWYTANSTDVKYTATGEIEESIDFDMEGKPELKTSYHKLEQGRITGNVQALYANGIWINYRKSEMEFNDQGNEIRNEYFTWKGNKWELVSGNKVMVEFKSDVQEIFVNYLFDETTNEYKPFRRTISNMSNQLIEQNIFQAYEENSWVNVEAEGYDYDQLDQISSVYYFTWDGTRFENKELYTNIIWHDYAAEEYSEMELKEWDGEKWINKQKSIYQYNLNKTVVGITLDFIENDWKFTYRISEEYDAHNNPKSVKVESYISNNWKLLAESKNENTYDNQNRLIETITKISNGFEWMNVAKETIDYKQRSTGINTEKNMITVFPNPSNDYIKVMTSHNSSAKINIYNTNSSLIKTIESSQLSDEKIDVRDLGKGMYIVEIIQDSKVYTSKLLVN